jgi:hypothetical protein
MGVTVIARPDPPAPRPADPYDVRAARTAEPAAALTDHGAVAGGRAAETVVRAPAGGDPVELPAPPGRYSAATRHPPAPRSLRQGGSA